MLLAPLTSALFLAVAAQAAEDPWVDGPEPASSDDLAPPSFPPREPGAPAWDLTTPPAPPDPWRVRAPALPPVDDDLRLATSLDRAALFRFGDLRLEDSLVQAPGLWRDQLQGAAPAFSVRGLSPDDLEVRVDGVPVLPAAELPGFPVLGLVPIGVVERLTVRHGPRLAGIGGASAAAGVVEIDTFRAPVDLGEGLPMSGALRLGWGGPDLEKGLQAWGTTGVGRVRVGLHGGLFDVEDLHLGRGLGELASSGARGGDLGASVDVAIREGAHLLARWTSARQTEAPLSERCVPDAAGRRTDCVKLEERGWDLFLVGADLETSLIGLPLRLSLRTHAQHFIERWVHGGARVTDAEKSRDQVFRAGALGSALVVLPGLELGFMRLSPSVEAGVELLRDRVRSGYASRSQRVIDAEPRGDGISDPSKARLIDGSVVDAGAVFARARLGAGPVDLVVGARYLGQQLGAPPSPRLDAPLGDLGGALSAELVARAQLSSELLLFAAATRTERPDALFARTTGPMRFEPRPLPAREGKGAFLEHAVEAGAGLELPWLSAEAVLWGALRSGVLIPGEEADAAGVARLVLGPERQAAGLEGRLFVRTGLDGLSLLANAGAALVEEGVPFDETAPMPGGLPVEGALALSFAPSSWPLSTYARLRYAAPQIFLSPAEEEDPLLCPERQQDPSAVCRGAAGHGVFDLGAAFAPTPQVRLDVLAENVLDQPWQLHGTRAPGGGLGVRAVLTLSL